MDFDTWWLLLLPTFFAAGWYAARWDLRQTIRAARQLPETYFKGLNHLLHDEPDQALDALIEVVKQDPETPQLHFALGALFRRRAEVDRAIRVHDNLLARRDLSDEHRNQARFELGLDYMKAGLLDQAEAALGPLDGTPLAVPAEELRIQIAQSTRDWPLAIRIARDLKAAGQTQLAQNEVHFHCNLVEQALSAKPANQEVVQQHFGEALACNPNHPRVALLALKIKDTGLSEAAVPTLLALDDFEAFGDRFPTYSPLIVDSYAAMASQRQSTERAQNKLAFWYSQHPSQDLLLAGLKLATRESESAIVGAQDAASQGAGTQGARPQGAGTHQGTEPLLPSWIETALRLKPTSLTIGQWVGSRDGLDAAAFKFLSEQLKTLNSKSGKYACKNCGFKASQHYWHCPGCAKWESYSTSTDESSAFH
jgi:lipopolysaccharide assembly protein B